MFYWFLRFFMHIAHQNTFISFQTINFPFFPGVDPSKCTSPIGIIIFLPWSYAVPYSKWLAMVTSVIMHMFRTVLISKYIQIKSLIQNLRQNCWIGEYCLLIELHRKGSTGLTRLVYRAWSHLGIHALKGGVSSILKLLPYICLCKVIIKIYLKKKIG